MTTWVIRGGNSLEGITRTPPDKSISHRALMLAALGEGTSRISPLSAGADNRSTLSLLQQMGVKIEISPDESEAIVHGVGGPQGLLTPDKPLDCGNSGTTMRLMAGIVSAMSGKVIRLEGDESLNGRPMSRLLPLTKMGSGIDGVRKNEKIYPPLEIRGAHLTGTRHELSVASAQVKSALLLAGLWAEGKTQVLEPGRSRDHTERMLRSIGVSVKELEDQTIELQPIEKPWRVEVFEVAPDVSSAAFLLGAALVTNSPNLGVETAVNPTRTGILDALAAFGVDVQRAELPAMGGEPMATLRIDVGTLSPAKIDGSLTLRAIDEIPLIAGLAAFIPGVTQIRDAGELRVKESDRIATTANLLRAFGAEVHEVEDGLDVVGNPKNLVPAVIHAGHDHRIAMTAAVIALGISGESRIEGAEIADVSYPGFVNVMKSFGGDISLG
ncbi:MAG: 3-phosphoshikimate 1-carboxyvinyltransferase [Myxococcota bacterium]|nr:3-phosphoshikimate 1-carboxyvinyltransferase [Myxococcota bacterium]